MSQDSRENFRSALAHGRGERGEGARRENEKKDRKGM